ncbi:MAG: PilW family protein [Deltaproteobacteria bacterium]|nr:PilW family protein [Deltaproteobacteria bacterium]MBW2046674.1 PilW family protein [Deltaproteobacteria bacterium]MBW2299249.1 PilW family protein [Deltaproteobacteria bacterium]
MHKQKGFTLLELLVAVALGLVIMAAVFKTFKSQQDSYVVQDQVAAMQQNLRAAMYVLTRDLQLAGYYSNFDRNPCSIDWDDHDNDNNTSTGTESIRPLIYAGNNVSASGDDIKNNTDTIVIVKAGEEGRTLAAGEEATGGVIKLSSRDLDGDGQADLNNTTKKFGLLVKSDLRTADFFEVNTASGNITPPGGLSENYTAGDLIFRADVIIYKIDENSTHPSLRRKNLGNNTGFRVIAEDIDNIQFRYQLNDGTWTDNPTGNEARVRAVEIFMLARTAHTIRGYTDPNTYNFADNPLTNPSDGYRRKLICSTVKTRNIGL